MGPSFIIRGKIATTAKSTTRLVATKSRPRADGTKEESQMHLINSIFNHYAGETGRPDRTCVVGQRMHARKNRPIHKTNSVGPRLKGTIGLPKTCLLKRFAIACFILGG